MRCVVSLTGFRSNSHQIRMKIIQVQAKFPDSKNCCVPARQRRLFTFTSCFPLSRLRHSTTICHIFSILFYRHNTAIRYIAILKISEEARRLRFVGVLPADNPEMALNTLENTLRIVCICIKQHDDDSIGLIHT